MRADLDALRPPPTNMPNSINAVAQRSFKLPAILDLIWILGLAVYIAAGMPLATFHADESMQIYTSEDFWKVFIDEDLESVITNPPYDIDSDAQLRILNGSVNRYTIGLTWMLADESRRDLPPAPGWNWGLSYEDNLDKDFRLAPDLLNLSRLPSTIFLILCLPLMGFLGRASGSRLGFFVATALFAFSPPILLNGRRALQEGSMLFFGLLTVVSAAMIANSRARRRPAGCLVWVIFIAAAALAIASKHTGLIFAAAGLGWIIISDLVNIKTWSNVFGLVGLFRITVSMIVLIGGLSFALLPALWSENPIQRFEELLTVRADLVEVQTQLFPETTLDTTEERINALLEQPFTAPLMHYEAPAWGESTAVQEEIAAYEASPLSGIDWGNAGVLPTVLALLGIGLAFVGLTRANAERRAFNAGLLAWLVITVGALLFNPLEWQRYYLPLMPIAFVLVALALNVLLSPRRVPLVADFNTSNDVIQSFR